MDNLILRYIKFCYGRAHQVSSKPADKPRKNNPQSVPTFVSSPNLSDIFNARAKSAYPESPPSKSRPPPTTSTIISNSDMYIPIRSLLHVLVLPYGMLQRVYVIFHVIARHQESL